MTGKSEDKKEEEKAPEPVRELTKKQRVAIIETLTEKSKGRSCDMCGGTNWVLHRQPVSPLLLTFTHETKAINLDLGYSYPSVMLVCSSCGNVKTFLLEKLGIDPFEEPGA
jgi:hypothetical protein